MTTWKTRTPAFVSPKIDSVDIVIDTIDVVIDRYGDTNVWSDRADGDTHYEAKYGLWVKNYYPWEEDALPWQREVLTTNWTPR
jgi:hypothetical protein